MTNHQKATLPVFIALAVMVLAIALPPAHATSSRSKQKTTTSYSGTTAKATTGASKTTASSGLVLQQTLREARINQNLVLADCFYSAATASNNVIGERQCNEIKLCMASNGFPDNFTCGNWNAASAQPQTPVAQPQTQTQAAQPPTPAEQMQKLQKLREQRKQQPAAKQ